MSERQLLQEWTRAVSARIADMARALDAPMTWLIPQEEPHEDGDEVASTTDDKWVVSVREMHTSVSYEPIARFGRLIAPLTEYELTEQSAQTTPQPVLSIVEQAAKALFRDLSRELIPFARARIPALVVTVSQTPKSQTAPTAEEAFGTGPLVRSEGIKAFGQFLELRVSLLAGVTVADHWSAS